MHTQWDEKAVPLQQEPTLVAEGPAPLVHLFDVGGPIRVVDMTQKRAIAATTIPDRTLLRVDEEHGVVAGSDTIAPGPLAAGHRFGIYADPSTENVFRRGQASPLRPDSH